MNSWIDLTALGQIVVASLLAGAGLPALVAVGLRALSPAALAPGAPSPRGVAVAAACFAVVLAAIGYGIYLIVSSSH